MALDADALIDRRRLKRRLLAWQLVALLALVGLAALVGAQLFEREEPHVARLDVSGLIVADRARDQALDELVDRAAARALLVTVDSPGGTTAGSEALFEALRRVAAAKPVVAVIGTLGASGGYVAAIAADRVFARETSLTGSIGVVLQTAEVTGLLERLGITAEAIKSAPLKGQPSPLEPLTPDARAAVEAVVADSYRWFRDLVAQRRGLDAAALGPIGDGRIFTGRQAVEHGLVDDLGGERAARAWLEAEHGVPADLPVVDLSYGEEEPLFARLTRILGGKVFSAEPLMLDGLVSVWHPR